MVVTSILFKTNRVEGLISMRMKVMRMQIGDEGQTFSAVWVWVSE